MTTDILEFFSVKTHIFYVKRVVFTPEDFALDFRMKEDELKLRLFQAVFDLKVENIILSIPDYELFGGLRLFILGDNIKKREGYEIVPFKEIKSMIPDSIYKSQKNETWESNILDKWREFSEVIETKEEAIKEFLQKITTRSYYGCNLFWVENYKYNKQKWLQKNMWMIVKYDTILFGDEKKQKEIISFDINEWKISHFPNAIIFGKSGEPTIRLTTTTVYPIYGLIKMYQKTRNRYGGMQDSISDFVIQEEPEEEKNTEENA